MQEEGGNTNQVPRSDEEVEKYQSLILLDLFQSNQNLYSVS